MTKLKSLSNKIRFEVFKRDFFTCQYCGQKAPNVILEVDHIKPVKNGGDNSILNLVTSCKICNNGKSDKELSDNSIIEQQRQQIEELSQRREQLEMMLKWRDGVQNQKDEIYNKAINHWNSKWNGYSLNNTGEKTLRKHIDNYGLIIVLDAIDLAFDLYSSNEDQKDVENTFKKLGGILYNQNKSKVLQKVDHVRNVYGYRFEVKPNFKVVNALKDYTAALSAKGRSDDEIIEDLDSEVIPMINKSNNSWKCLQTIYSWTEDINNW